MYAREERRSDFSKTMKSASSCEHWWEWIRVVTGCCGWQAGFGKAAVAYSSRTPESEVAQASRYTRSSTSGQLHKGSHGVTPMRDGSIQ